MAVPTNCQTDQSIFPPYANLPDPMPAKKLAGRGVSLKVDGVTIANFLSISSTGGEAERIDVTTHDTPGRYREFRPSFASELTSTFDIIWDPTHPSHQWLAYLFQTGQVVPIVVQIWNRELDAPGAEILFTGFVSGFPMPSFPIDGPYTVTVSITISGEIRFPGMEGAVDPGSLTSAFTGCPGVFMPVGDEPPADLAALQAADIEAFPSSAWVGGAYVVLGDGSNAFWDGSAWSVGMAPDPDPDT